jgi:hypothetical protein
LFAPSLLDLHPHNKFTLVPDTASANPQNNPQDTQMQRKPYKMCDEPPWSCFDLEEEAAVDAFEEQQPVPRVHWRDGGVAPARPDSIRSDLAILSIPEDELEPHFQKYPSDPNVIYRTFVRTGKIGIRRTQGDWCFLFRETTTLLDCYQHGLQLALQGSQYRDALIDAMVEVMDDYGREPS